MQGCNTLLTPQKSRRAGAEMTLHYIAPARGLGVPGKFVSDLNQPGEETRRLTRSLKLERFYYENTLQSEETKVQQG